MTCSELIVSVLYTGYHTYYVSLSGYKYSLSTLTCLQVTSVHEKLGDITRAILKELALLCTDCGITDDIIDEQSIFCSEKSPEFLIYRARLKGTAHTDSRTLRSLIEEWVSRGGSIIVTGILMPIDSECAVAISSLSEAECETSSTDTNTSSTNNSTGAIIGGVVAAILIAIALVIVAIVALKRHRHRQLFFGKAQE